MGTITYSFSFGGRLMEDDVAYNISATGSAMTNKMKISKIDFSIRVGISSPGSSKSIRLKRAAIDAEKGSPGAGADYNYDYSDWVTANSSRITLEKPMVYSQADVSKFDGSCNVYVKLEYDSSVGNVYGYEGSIVITYEDIPPLTWSDKNIGLSRDGFNITVKWNAATPASYVHHMSYTVVYGTEALGYGYFITSGVADLQHTFTYSEYGSTYGVTVYAIAYDAYGLEIGSLSSNIGYIATPAITLTAPGKPTIIQEKDSVQITWTPSVVQNGIVNEPIYYYVQGTSASGKGCTLDPNTANSITASVKEKLSYEVWTFYVEGRLGASIIAKGPSTQIELKRDAVHYTIKCYINDGWQKCIVFYFDGNNWVECVPNYYDGSKWDKCSF